MSATKPLTTAQTKKLFALRSGDSVKKEALIALYGEHATTVLLAKDFIAYGFTTKKATSIVLWKKLPTFEQFAKLLDGFRVTVADLIERCTCEQGNAVNEHDYYGTVDMYEVERASKQWPADLLAKQVLFFGIHTGDSPFDSLSEALHDYAEEQKTQWWQLAEEIASEGLELQDFEPEYEEDEDHAEAA